jgi:hypothetical protein
MVTNLKLSDPHQQWKIGAKAAILRAKTSKGVALQYFAL